MQLEAEIVTRQGRSKVRVDYPNDARVGAVADAISQYLGEPEGSAVRHSNFASFEKSVGTGRGC